MLLVVAYNHVSAFEIRITYFPLTLATFFYTIGNWWSSKQTRFACLCLTCLSAVITHRLLRQARPITYNVYLLGDRNKTQGFVNRDPGTV